MQQFALIPRSSEIFENNLQLNQSMYKLLQWYRTKSTCLERKVSAVMSGFYLNGFRILSVGVNGVPNEKAFLPLYLHKRHCTHAEDQAIRNLPLDFYKYVLVSYSSLAPCYNCAKKLYYVGVRAHVYISEYDDPTGVDYLLNNGVAVYKLGSSRLVAVHSDIHLKPSWVHNIPD